MICETDTQQMHECNINGLRRLYEKCLSVVLSVVMFVTLLFSPASAEGLIGNMDTDVQIYGPSELSVRTLISRYFAQRKVYLQGKADTITTVVDPMVADEAAHKETLTAANAVLTV